MPPESQVANHILNQLMSLEHQGVDAEGVLEILNNRFKMTKPYFDAQWNQLQESLVQKPQRGRDGLRSSISLAQQLANQILGELASRGRQAVDAEGVLRTLNSRFRIKKLDFDAHWKLFQQSSLRKPQPRRSEIQSLTCLQKVAQSPALVQEHHVQKLIAPDKKDLPPFVRGEICYLLGRLGRTDAIRVLLSSLDDDDEYVIGEARKALYRLGQVMDKQVEREIDREEEAYLAKEDELLEAHPGEYVAFYEGKLVAIAPTKAELMRVTESEIGHVRYYIRRITRELPEVRPPTSRKLESM